jgi:16S rRNA (cytosine967-C5)-methyltransferase
MQPGARLKAAAEVLDDIIARHRPPNLALGDWGKSHRFAGSGDRSAIGTIVYDVLRLKASSGFIAGNDTSRGLVLGMLRQTGLSAEDILSLCSGPPHALDPLSRDEFQKLDETDLATAPDHIRTNTPEWLMPTLQSVFGAATNDELEAQSHRAPIDIRVNPLKATRERVLEDFARFDAEPLPFTPFGVRIPAPKESKRAPNIEAETAHGKGWFEVQDLGSQIAAALTGAGPRQQILDLCAGAGGKTLAMAGPMQNTGQIFAHDSDKIRLRPIFERLKRAGARNVQVLAPHESDTLDELGAHFDVTLVDAPCTGSGTWRRKPDAKWRLKPESLGLRLDEQTRLLDRAAPTVKPGGKLVYVTCSLLPAENTEQIAAFLARHKDFAIQPWRDAWAKAPLGAPPERSADGRDDTLLLTPKSHGTDGFFIAILQRAV